VFLDAPRGFRNPDLVAARMEMLESEPRVQPLREWAADLAARRDAVVPWFDPAEAGIDTRVLLVFEAPGPMTFEGHKRRGSGFISADNNDQTAENTWRSRAEAGLHDGALCWNIVPWYLGPPASVRPTADDLKDGADALVELMRLLPKLDTVVVSGRFAQRGWNRHLAHSLRRPDVRVIETWHPSPLALNHPGKRDEYVAALREAATAP